MYRPSTHCFHPRRRFAGRVAAALAAALIVPASLHAEENAPVVAVTPVTRQDLATDLSVQGEFRPYQEIDVHAKVAGYVRDMSVDIGDQVKAGDVIANLEVPELEEDLTRSEAAVRRAEANYEDAHVAHMRLIAVMRTQPKLVAQQDLDAAAAKDAGAEAEVAEAKAEMAKYKTLESYTRITAPFNGVVTKRYADVGALIQAGTSSNTQTMPIVRLSQNDRLRLDFPISVAHASEIKIGDPVEIRLEGDRLLARSAINRFSRRISFDTRTMDAETEVPNPDLKLIPGMYVTVGLKLDRRPHALSVPIEAVSGTKEPTVYVVNLQHHVEERHVQIGIETPTRYEVLSGLKEGELVMIGGRSEVQPGQTVTPKQTDIVVSQ